MNGKRVGEIAAMIIGGAALAGCFALLYSGGALSGHSYPTSPNMATVKETAVIQPAPIHKLFYLTASSFVYDEHFNISLFNSSDKTISGMFIEISLTTKEGFELTKTIRVRNIDSNKDGLDTVYWPYRYAPAQITVRKVFACELEGRYTSDCGDYLGTPPASSKYVSQVPIDFKIPHS